MESIIDHKLYKALEAHDPVFKAIVSAARPILTDAIQTAAVTLINDKVRILINKKFFESLSNREKVILLIHEGLHLILNHLNRIKLDASSNDQLSANIAADLEVNQLIINWLNMPFEKFGDSNAVTFKTFFENSGKTTFNTKSGKTFELKDISRNGTYEYYEQFITDELSNSFMQSAGGCSSGPGADGAAPNSGTDGSLYRDIHISEEDAAKIKDFFKSVSESMTADERKKTSESAGRNASTVLREFTKTYMRSDTVENIMWKRCPKIQNSGYEDRWGFTPRKLAALKTGLDVPDAREFAGLEPDTNVVFLDRSGSCESYIQSFVDIVTSLPPRIKTVLHVFCTEVEKIDKKKLEFRAGGGTSFKCIEDYILDKFKKYPKNVYVFTDGYGDDVSPKHPERWCWFNIGKYESRNYPKESVTYFLSDLGYDL